MLVIKYYFDSTSYGKHKKAENFLPESIKAQMWKSTEAEKQKQKSSESRGDFLIHLLFIFIVVNERRGIKAQVLINSTYLIFLLLQLFN